MNKTLRKTLIILLIAIIMLLPVTYAWVSDNGLSSPIAITSNVHKAYFESGNGTKDIEYDGNGKITKGPYEIAKPLQLYYFAWLQYLGYFNVDNDNDGQIDTIYFRLSKDLDMKENSVTYILPPIGTTKHPFLGNFDGEGHVISNLTVDNKFASLIDPPEITGEFSNAEIIGFFGVVGELNKDDYNYDTQTNQIKNLILQNLTVKTQTTNALVGLVAGYVNGTVDCVGVVDSTIDIANGTQLYQKSEITNISDYSIIGYCTDDYRDDVYVVNMGIKNPGASDVYDVVPKASEDGSVNGWGGSINMTDIYDMLTGIRNDDATSNSNYYYERTDVTDLNGNTTTLTSNEYTTTKTMLTHSIEGFGSFVFSSNDYANYVNFIAGAQKVNSYKYTYNENEQLPLYNIVNNGYYLNFNGSTISSGQNQNTATLWYIDDGKISTVVNGILYHLIVTNNTLSCVGDYGVSENSITKWTKEDNAIVYNNQKLVCQNGTWRLSSVSAESGYTISRNNNYLSINNNNNGVQNQTSVNNATIWQLNQITNGYTLSTTATNGTTYYLGFSTGNNPRLQISTTASTWQYNSTNGQLTCLAGRNNNTTYYLRYSNGWSLSTTNNNNNRLTFTLVEVFDTLANQNGTASKVERTEKIYIDNSIENTYYDENGELKSTGPGLTYFPLISETVDGKRRPKATNTGYIVGAEWDTLEEQQQDGVTSNLRISRYTLNSGMTNTNSPLTMTYKTGDTFTGITTSGDNTAEKLKLQKYTNCYSTFIQKQSGNVWDGLHFMDAPILKSNVTEITATLRNETKYNYQVPTNCIDFNLYERGFINFFAGSYYTQGNGNNSFFSIYQIIRDENDKITDIREIYKVYALLDANDNIITNKDYFYTFLVDGVEVIFDKDGKKQTTITIPEGYSMVFDCRWITHSSEYDGWLSVSSNNPANSRLFYFEVPVNAGEYAIGSTQGRTGAYLVYLDLAANAQQVERVKEYEEITEVTTITTIPNGVEILVKSESGYSEDVIAGIDSKNSAFASVNEDGSGTITISKTDENTFVYSGGSGLSAQYVGSNNSLVDKEGTAITGDTTVVRTTTITKTTYRDNNITEQTQTVTVITKKVIKEGNEEQTLYMRTVTTTDSEGNQTTETTDWQEEELFPEIIETNNVELKAGDTLINLAFANRQIDSAVIDYTYVPATQNEGAKYIITITNQTEEPIDIKAILTADGVNSKITFIITDGTNEYTLFQKETEDNKKVTIETVTIPAKANA